MDLGMFLIACCQKCMMTSSNGNIFRVTGHLCGEFTVPGEFPTQRPVTRGFDVYFDLRPNKRLSKQSWGWWFEMPSRPLWRHLNGAITGRAHFAIARQSNLMSIKMWDELTYISLNFNDATVEVWEFISNYIPHIMVDMITYPYQKQS